MTLVEFDPDNLINDGIPQNVTTDDQKAFRQLLMGIGRSIRINAELEKAERDKLNTPTEKNPSKSN